MSLQHDLRRLARQLRELSPCTCPENKGLKTHPRRCPVYWHAEEWRIAGELDALAASTEAGVTSQETGR